MGLLEIFLCIYVGQLVAVQAVIHEQPGTFSRQYPRQFPGFFENILSPFERQFGFAPHDTFFDSWRTWTPDFHMLGDFSPIRNVPKVEVFCDESALTLLVEKRVSLAREEMRLGDGCHSNRELPNHFVFTYSLDECGTARVMQNGVDMFTNTLHMNLRNPGPTWWQTPYTVHVSCIPKRSYTKPNFPVSMAPPENSNTFTIRAMNPSWTSSAESNVYKRGQVMNLQVSAKARPDQQLFIQSCFVSSSPDIQTRPKHAVIMNKGCVAPLGSPYAVVQFVASDRPDVVNFVLNTTYLISELYIHCSVLLSDLGVTFGSKSCNYNVIQSRWEDLGGAEGVCECCSSKCKGLSVRHLPEDARAITTTGPLVIVGKEVEKHPEPPVSEPQETSGAPVADTMQSDASDGVAAEDVIVSGASVSRSKLTSPPQGVVVVSQDPVARLTIWLPGQMQEAPQGENDGSKSEDRLTVTLQAGDILSNDLPELQPPTTDQQGSLNIPSNKIEDKNVNILSLADGWLISPLLEEVAIAEESSRKIHLGRSDMFGVEVDIPLADEMAVPHRNDFSHVVEKADAVVKEGATAAPPVIRSKLQFSKGLDGSQTLSYEEEVVKQQDGDGGISRFEKSGIRRTREPRQKGLRSTFLDLLRRMDKAE